MAVDPNRNKYEIVVGSNVYTSDTLLTLIMGGKLHWKRDFPGRLMVELEDRTAAVVVAVGDLLRVKLKARPFNQYEGRVTSVERDGSRLTVQGDDLLRKLKDQHFNELLSVNLRRTNFLDIKRDTTNLTSYYTDFKVGADAVQYPVIRVDYVSPAILSAIVITQTTQIAIEAGANRHFAQLFRAEGEYLEGGVGFGIVQDAFAAQINARLRVVVNSGGESNPRPATDGAGNFLHAQHETGGDAVVDTAMGLDNAANTHKITSFAFARIRTIPGALYWYVAERASEADVTSIRGYGSPGPRQYPYRALNGSGHTPSTWSELVNNNFKLKVDGPLPNPNLLHRVSAEKRLGADFTVDEALGRIVWGGTSSFVPDLDTNGVPTGGARVVYAHGTQAIGNAAAGGAEPVNYVLARCGVLGGEQVIEAGVDATYGLLRIKARSGLDALEQLLVKRKANAAGTRFGRFFASSFAGEDVHVRLENLTSDEPWTAVANGKDAVPSPRTVGGAHSTVDYVDLITDAQAADFYNGFTIEFLTGANQGVVRKVIDSGLAVNPGDVGHYNLRVSPSLPAVPLSTDAFTVQADAIVNRRKLVKVTRYSATRVEVFGKDSTGETVVGIAEDTSLLATLGRSLRIEHDEAARSDAEARTIAEGILADDLSTDFRGEVELSGFWPEATGHFGATGYDNAFSTFNDVFRFIDTDLGITAASQTKFRAEEVIIDLKAVTTTLIVTRKERNTGLARVIEDLRARIARREALDLGDGLHLSLRTAGAISTGTVFAELQDSVPAALVSWDGQVARAKATHQGGGKYRVSWAEHQIDLGAGSEPTRARATVKHVKLFDAERGGTLLWTHTFDNDERTHPPPRKPMLLTANTN